MFFALVFHESMWKQKKKTGRELCVCVCVCFLLLLDENARPPIRRIDSQLEQPDPLCAHGDNPPPAHCELCDPARHPRLHGFPPSIPQENHLIMRRRDEVLAVEEPGACAHTLAVTSEGGLTARRSSIPQLEVVI